MSIIVNSALRLAAPDIEALIQGNIITALSRVFIDRYGALALYPSDNSINLLPVEKQYRSKFVPIAHSSFQGLNPDKVLIRSWATCELCQPITHLQILDSLSELTIWTPEALREMVAQRKTIFLTYLRVCLLPKPLEIPYVSTGNFVGLQENLNIAGSRPILKDQDFIFAKNQLENLLELQDELSNSITPVLLTQTPSVVIPVTTNPTIDLKPTPVKNVIQPIESNLTASGLSWINDIVTLGDRSIETDERKSNVRAGTDFENIVKKSLEFIGFTVDHVHAGGSGGLDLFCSKPFPLIGECKSGKNIPGNTVYELDNLSDDHLEDHVIAEAQKLIIGAGKPTPQIQKRAIRKNISMINPISLQKLVKLNSKYFGSVNLIELRPYLIAGQADHKIDEYIQKVENDIQLRSQIVSLVGSYLSSRKVNDVELKVLEGVFFNNPHTHNLSIQEVKEILIELSSPLAGYLGRVEEDGRKCDRFYYLRDLPCDES
jgi:hypothetical protein